MERNHNPQVVTISTELYRELVAMADTAIRYTTKRITQHARKFNPHLQPEHQQKVLDHERERSKQIRLARQVVGKYAGKLMYARVQMYLNSDKLDPVYAAVIVRRVNSKARHLVDVYRASEINQRFKSNCSVSPSALIETLPEGYIDGVGNYTHYLVKANGNCDLREEMAERERYRTARAKATTETNTDRMLVCEVKHA